MTALPGLDRLVGLAEPLAGAWAARARASRTVGTERAVLRAFGVGGLDVEGRPLAGAVVDRWLSGSPHALGSGIALPFTMAVIEYDQPPRELALDIASGAVDLAMESRLLAEADRRAAAELEARRLGRLALERIDANRIARRELLDILGDAARPWLGAIVAEPTARAAGTEAAALVRAGADVIRVAVPTGRELATRMLDLGLERPDADVGDVPAAPDDDAIAAPAGSQRGLAALRLVLDQLAAERRGYVRLATAAPALSAPEHAVVAAFERVDLAEGDPLAEIVEVGVDPDRALADHAFAIRLHARAGDIVCVGPGPLVVAPDLARGVPPDPTSLAGRALALQLLAVRFAVLGGLDPSAVAVAALPDWLLDEPDAAARGLAEVAVRRALFEAHPLAFTSPTRREGSGRVRIPPVWSYLLAATLPDAGPTALVYRAGPVERYGFVAAEHRAAADVAAAVARGREPAALRGDAEAHADGMLASAVATLERLRDSGWRAILGDPMGGPRPAGLGGDAVVERTEPFDPFA